MVESSGTKGILKKTQVNPEFDENRKNLQTYDDLDELQARQKLYIELKSDVIEVGGLVKGTIVHEVSKEITASNLNLKLKVKEESAWENQQDIDGRLEYNSYKARVVYFNHLYPIMLWDEETVLKPDTYRYNFQFKLDRNHPVSIDMRSNQDFYGARIVSRVKAEVKFKKKRKLKSSKYFQVIHSKKQILSIDVNPIIKQLGYLMTSCFCCEQGDLKIRLILKKNTFQPGEKLLGRLEVENCDIEISSIEARVFELVQLRDLFKHVTEFKGNLIATNQMAGLKRKECNKNYQISVDIPPEIEATNNQKLITKTYQLNIIFNMNSSWPLSYPVPRITSNFWVYNSDILKQKKEPIAKSQADFSNVNGLNDNPPDDPDQKIYEIAWSRVMYYPPNERKYGIFSCPIWEYSNPARLMQMNANTQNMMTDINSIRVESDDDKKLL